MTSCPICLESVFENDENNKIEYNIGAAVPCGHIYHYDCFDSWRASQIALATRHGGVKCPTCNIHTDDFIRIFLDISSIASSSYYHLALDERDDDVSLSSVEDDGNHNDGGTDTSYETAPTSSPKEKFVCIEEEQSTLISNLHPCQNQPIMLDLTSSMKQTQGKPNIDSATSIWPPTSSSFSQLQGSSNQSGELYRLKRIAKKFKRQFLQKNVQYREQYEEKRRISDKYRKSEKELSKIKDGMDGLKRNQQLAVLHLNEARIALQRTLKEVDELKSRNILIEKEKSNLETQLKKCHSYYEGELENARMKSMSEMQQILEDHPKVVEENRILKQRLQKMSRNSRGLKNSSGCNTKSKRNSTRDITKALREMDDQVRSSKATTHLTNELNNAPSVSDNRVEGSDIKISKSRSSNNRINVSSLKVSGQYSSLASRLVTASSTKTKTKLSQNIFVLDMMSFKSSWESSKANKKESQKRSTSAVAACRSKSSKTFSTSQPSLSFLQNKRMKISRKERHIFQGKH